MRRMVSDVSQDSKRLRVGTLDDRGGNRKRIEQAGVVRRHKMRIRAQIVRAPMPFHGRRPPCCSLHARFYAPEELIRSIYRTLHAVVNGG